MEWKFSEGLGYCDGKGTEKTIDWQLQKEKPLYYYAAITYFKHLKALGNRHPDSMLIQGLWKCYIIEHGVAPFQGNLPQI